MADNQTEKQKVQELTVQKLETYTLQKSGLY